MKKIIVIVAVLLCASAVARWDYVHTTKNSAEVLRVENFCYRVVHCEKMGQYACQTGFTRNGEVHWFDVEDDDTGSLYSACETRNSRAAFRRENPDNAPVVTCHDWEPLR